MYFCMKFGKMIEWIYLAHPFIGFWAFSFFIAGPLALAVLLVASYPNVSYVLHLASLWTLLAAKIVLVCSDIEGRNRTIRTMLRHRDFK